MVYLTGIILQCHYMYCIVSVENEVGRGWGGRGMDISITKYFTIFLGTRLITVRYLLMVVFGVFTQARTYLMIMIHMYL